MAPGRRGRHTTTEGGHFMRSTTQATKQFPLSPSSSSTMEPSTEDSSAFSCAPSSSEAEPCITTKSSKRGPTRGKGTIIAARVALGGKLFVTFNSDCRQAICTNAEKFNNEIGFVIRNHGTFTYKEWRLVPEEVRAPLRQYLLESFDINLCDKTTLKCIDEQMRKAWRGHKYKLHTYFKEIGGEKDVELANRKPHPELKVNQHRDWEILCDYWTSEKFQVIIQLILLLKFLWLILQILSCSSLVVFF
ncbi:uncharacterized protein LOC133783775 isoform X2 [Humulus lupulus]|nr:uncharacterized protein LOC133783775 isoform X2 [Humulus lupulus]XP_062079391.1 uncharacterized protein LOC133783775 isoform X2 [Humulus lupulus]XP_062079392.1 uncharacterized protein LOC133783775 isoform X2 [Humulus lupulus]XP_062079393.1 uncharacterized protein LOC133783775 isoform X2 [Humulus lupulus]